MVFVLPPLDYSKNSLVPHISENTVENHYEGHHAGYIKNLNKLLQHTNLLGKDLEYVIKSSKNNGMEKIFNNAAQIWNHNFYWQSIKPNGGGRPSGIIEAAIVDSFGSYEQFYQKFKEVAMRQFGSGWVWLVSDNNKKLDIISTSNAETPIAQDNVYPLLTSDVWEHSYYLDYQYRRLDYISAFLDNLLNWSFANKNLNFEN
ncbi:superoxide dismutase (Fe) [Candidatus Xenohaliotis californiensis]|uniref:Superoxide dismutase n=1 Tax=Candidatus Xenohaliotis californiensis TaxID=84677 RepID=A0ABM9N8M3_9RICK|nr:superoxide dismutase (Fe) [Candidatus Xenohaliotis californiensis]